MDVEIKQVGKTVIIKIEGELDMLMADEMRQKTNDKLQGNDIKTLILDMEKVSFIDSSGLGVIIGTYKKVAADNGGMYIIGAQPPVEKILFFSGINKLVKMYKSDQDIINSLK